ncbi:unnamed protein product [Lasius platythorax]|uniref:Peptidase A2 domain-containing protein n=1 Tax=Lasius platythorax TaxID=488582 RepID=A0AAV2MYT1_9HYME
MTDLQVQGGALFLRTARIDTGCPVTLVQESLIDGRDLQTPGQEWNKYRGINNSKLRVKGIVKVTITLDGYSKPVIIGVLPDNTMSVLLLIGRDALKYFNYCLTNSPIFDKAMSEILLVCNDSSCIDSDGVDINVSYDVPPGAFFFNEG